MSNRLVELEFLCIFIDISLFVCFDECERIVSAFRFFSVVFMYIFEIEMICKLKV